jgi:hypothetical protein
LAFANFSEVRSFNRKCGMIASNFAINFGIWVQRCWPNSETISVFHIEKLFEKGNEAFVRYECERIAGPKFRNAEYLIIEGDKIKEVEVYFGSLPEAVLGK